MQNLTTNYASISTARSNRLSASALPDRNTRIQRCLPSKLPFPKSRLDTGELAHINGRDQFMDSRGSYVLTQVSALPPGGACQKIETDQENYNTLVLGDMGSDTLGRADVLNQVQRLSHSFTKDSKGIVFGLGDWVYPYGPIDRSEPEVQRVKQQILTAFAALPKQAPTYGILGNHEYGVSSQPADPGVFMDLAKREDIAFPGRYYSVQVQGHHWAVDYFALDSSTLACDEDQQRWLSKEVKSSESKEMQSQQKRWRVIMAHHPLVSYGLHEGETTYLIDLLGDALKSIDLYCCGHEHDLEYIESKDIPPVLLSGTSSESRSVLDGPDSSFSSSSSGFAGLTFSQHAIDVHFYDGKSAAILHQSSITRQ